jgi:hypothetical protein
VGIRLPCVWLSPSPSSPSQLLSFACAAACSLPESRTPPALSRNATVRVPLTATAAAARSGAFESVRFVLFFLFCSGFCPRRWSIRLDSTRLDTLNLLHTHDSSPRLDHTTASRRRLCHHDPAARRARRGDAAREPALQHRVQRQRVPTRARLPLEPDPLAGERGQQRVGARSAARRGGRRRRAARGQDECEAQACGGDTAAACDGGAVDGE